MSNRPNEIEAEAAASAQQQETSRAGVPDGKTSRHSGAGERVLKVPIDKLVPSPTNPRKHFDAAAIKELGQDLKDNGQHQPILVRAHPKREGFFEIIVGERRYRAAKEAKLPTVDAIHREMNDFQVIKKQWGENHQRKDIGPLEEAEAFANMKKLGNLKNNDEIAKEAGVSKETVYNRLKLLELSDEGKKLLAAGEIQTIQATHIARLTHSDQLKALKACMETQGIQFADEKGRRKQERRTMSVRELQVWISEHLHVDLKKAYFDPEDAKLFPAAGKCSTCPFNTACAGNLFPDPQGRSICTKTDCFEKKTEAALQARLVELSKDGKKVVKIACGHFHGAGRLASVKYDEGYPNQLRYCTEKCKSEVTGLVVQVGNHPKHKVGAAVKICIDKSCNCWPSWERPAASESGKSNKSSKAKAQKEREKAAALERKIDDSIKEAHAKAMLDALPRKVDLKYLRMLGVMLEGWLSDEMAKALGLKGRGSVSAETIKRFDEAKLVRYMFAAQFDVVCMTDVELERFAKDNLKVDLKAIEQKVRAELTPKPKEPAKDKDRVSGKEIAAKIKAAKKSKTPKAKKKK